MIPNLEEQIVELYTKNILSVHQIAKSLDVSSYRVEKTLKKNRIIKRSISEAITAHSMHLYGLKEFMPKKILSSGEELLKVAGVALYWGEGAKRHGSVALSNSDPAIIKVFMRFLREVCGIAESRLYVSVHYYPDHDLEELVTFWSDITSIPTTQFYKPYLHTRKRGTYKRISRYGTISVQYSDRRLLVLILSWIDDYGKSLG